MNLRCAKARALEKRGGKQRAMARHNPGVGARLAHAIQHFCRTKRLWLVNRKIGF